MNVPISILGDCYPDSHAVLTEIVRNETMCTMETYRKVRALLIQRHAEAAVLLRCVAQCQCSTFQCTRALVRAGACTQLVPTVPPSLAYSYADCTVISLLDLVTPI